MLETLTQTNIGALNLPELIHEDRSGLPFDPYKDLTLEDWGKIKQGIHSAETLSDYITYRGQARILFPERENELGLSDDIWSKIHVFLGIQTAESIYSSARGVEMLANALLAFPKRAAEIKVFSELIRSSKNHHIMNSSRAGRFDVPTWVSDLALISPEDLPSYPGLEAYKQSQLEVFEDTFDGRFSEAAYRSILPAARFRLVFPDHQLNISPEAWRVIREYFTYAKSREDTPEFNWRQKTNLFFSLKILAAEEVRITDQGLELVMPQAQAKLTEEVPALPEMRKF
ncbi:MAG: hypothetical protein Q7R49_01795 [Candidatus Daviesbacteria bacterium]|nr:hypothetical protein [Candidatus Daviesbacteria bacterium]